MAQVRHSMSAGTVACPTIKGSADFVLAVRSDDLGPGGSGFGPALDRVQVV